MQQYTYNNMRTNLLILLLFLFSGAFAQIPAEHFLHSLDSLGHVLYANNADSVKLGANQELEQRFEDFLQKQASVDLPVDSLKFIKRVAPDDDHFRLFTWAVPLSEHRYLYSGLMQRLQHGKPSGVAALRQGSMPVLENETYDGQHWPGAVYTQLIEKKDDQTFYTLLGWMGDEPGKARRVIDVLTFGDDGSMQFGLPVFVLGKKVNDRVIFEFTSEVPFHLAWEEQRVPGKKRKKEWMIVFNHLGGNDPAMGRMFKAAVPAYDQFDAFLFEKGRWVLHTDVDVRTETQKYEAPQELQLSPR